MISDFLFESVRWLFEFEMKRLSIIDGIYRLKVTDMVETGKKMLK